MSKLNGVPVSAIANNDQEKECRSELESLIGLFFTHHSRLGEFEYCDSQQLPSAYAKLLAHTSHMTVTVENRHGCSVNVEVLQSKRDNEHYCREILLRRESDNRVVQYGIVRLLNKSLADEVFNEILSERIPLGRVLINHEVMRQVELLGLWRVVCGERLLKLMDLQLGQATYGRTALIYCDSEPAIELLEIVAPEECFSLLA